MGAGRVRGGQAEVSCWIRSRLEGPCIIRGVI